MGGKDGGGTKNLTKIAVHLSIKTSGQKHRWISIDKPTDAACRHHKTSNILNEALGSKTYNYVMLQVMLMRLKLHQFR